MRRKKVEKTTVVKRLTEENAAAVLGRYARRSCRGAVGLFFNVAEGYPVPREVARECAPGMLMFYTRGEVRDGKILGRGIFREEVGNEGRIYMPIAMIDQDTGVQVSWHEWADKAERAR